MDTQQWHYRFLCECGRLDHHVAAHSDAFFLGDALCAGCGSRLRYSTTRIRCRWQPGSWGIFRPAATGGWVYHPEDEGDVPFAFTRWRPTFEREQVNVNPPPPADRQPSPPPPPPPARDPGRRYPNG